MYWRTIRVFVSSTFRDFPEERAALKRVQTELNAQLAQYSMDVVFVDLRWGIVFGGGDVEQRERHILKRCSEEILSSTQFIALLGDQVGWIPGQDLVAQSLPKIPGGATGQWSVTQLECLLGLENIPSGPLFYVFQRNPDDALPTATQKLLGRARESDACVRWLNQPAGEERVEQFVSMVRTDLLERILEEVPISIQSANGRYFSAAEYWTPCSDADVRAAVSLVTDKGRSRVIIDLAGNTEMAGTAVLARVAADLRAAGHTVLLHSTQSSASARDLRAFLGWLWSEIAEVAASPDEMDVDDLIVALREVLDSTDLLPIVLIDRVDAFEQLRGMSPLVWMSTLNLVVVATATSMRGLSQLRLGALSRTDAVAFARTRAASFGRHISDDVVDALCALTTGEMESCLTIGPPGSRVEPGDTDFRELLCIEDHEWLTLALTHLMAPDAPWLESVTALPLSDQAQAMVAVVRGLPPRVEALYDVQLRGIMARIGVEAAFAILGILAEAPDRMGLDQLLELANLLLGFMPTRPAGRVITAADITYVRTQLPVFIQEDVDGGWRLVGDSTRAAIRRLIEPSMDRSNWRNFLHVYGYPVLQSHSASARLAWFASARSYDDVEVMAKLLAEAHPSSGEAREMVGAIWASKDPAGAPIRPALECLANILDAWSDDDVAVVWGTATLAEGLRLAGEPVPRDQRSLAVGLILQRLTRLGARTEDLEPEYLVALVATNFLLCSAAVAGVADAGQSVEPTVLQDIEAMARPVLTPDSEAMFVTGTRIVRAFDLWLCGERERAVEELRLADEQTRQDPQARTPMWYGSLALAARVALVLTPDARVVDELREEWRRLNAAWLAAPMSALDVQVLAVPLVLVQHLDDRGLFHEAAEVMEQAAVMSSTFLELLPNCDRAGDWYQVMWFLRGQHYWRIKDAHRARRYMDEAAEVVEYCAAESRAHALLSACLTLHLCELELSLDSGSRAITALQRLKAAIDRLLQDAIPPPVFEALDRRGEAVWKGIAGYLDCIRNGEPSQELANAERSVRIMSNARRILTEEPELLLREAEARLEYAFHLRVAHNPGEAEMQIALAADRLGQLAEACPSLVGPDLEDELRVTIQRCLQHSAISPVNRPAADRLLSTIGVPGVHLEQLAQVARAASELGPLSDASTRQALTDRSLDAAILWAAWRPTLAASFASAFEVLAATLFDHREGD